MHVYEEEDDYFAEHETLLDKWTPPPMGNRYPGTLVQWIPQRHFGFIAPSDSVHGQIPFDRLFFHEDNLMNTDPLSLVVGQEVWYCVGIDHDKDKPQALDVNLGIRKDIAGCISSRRLGFEAAISSSSSAATDRRVVMKERKRRRLEPRDDGWRPPTITPGPGGRHGHSASSSSKHLKTQIPKAKRQRGW